MKIGTPVVYQQGTDDTPMGYRVGHGSRQHAAQVSFVYSDGTADLVVFPFGYYQHVYVQQIKRGKPDSEEKCWYLPEEGA